MAIAHPGLANPSSEEAAMQKLRTDCRAEGEAAGLSQRALEAYIARCVADLLSVEIHNLRKE